jgi:hypothetical protein
MVANLFGTPGSGRYGVGKMMLVGHSRCGRRGTEPARSRLKGEILRRLREGSGHAHIAAITNHRVVPTMTVTAAGFAFLLDVRDFATGRDLAIASNDAPAGESGEAKKSNETHKTLKRISIIARTGSKFRTRRQPAF